MRFQKMLEIFHKKIKVETEELREKRDILIDKIKSSLKDKGHPIFTIINQGSYIYGVGIKPLSGQEYDIDVGFVFPINSKNFTPNDVRSWVFAAIKNHTNNVEERGPCIRVRYAAGYHIDLVIYAQFCDDSGNDNFQLAKKDNTWSSSEPKRLKDYIDNARQKFSATKDSSGSDQIQRITRYLKRWNDLDIPEDSPSKPSGLATLLLVIKNLPAPMLDSSGTISDIDALISIAQQVCFNMGRIVINKPTQPYEDLYEKLDEKAMTRFKQRFACLLSDLGACKSVNEVDAIELLKKQFGNDFPDKENKEFLIEDIKRAVPTFSNPAKPWGK